MKKVLSLVIALTMILSLAACGGSSNAPAAAASEAKSAAAAAVSEAKSEAAAAVSEAKSEAAAAVSEAKSEAAAAVSEAKSAAEEAAGDIPVYEGTDVFEAIDMYEELFPDATPIRFVSAADSNSYRNRSGGPQVLAYYLAKELPVRTEGRYKFQLFADGSIASTASDTFSGLLLGSFEMASLGTVDEYSDAFTELGIPYAFADYDQILSVLQSGYQDVLAEKFEADVDGVKLLNTAPGGFREISNNSKEIHTPADVKGMKFRVLATEAFVKAFEAMGASVVTLSINELFTALQQGMVDGQENAITVFVNNAFYDVQKYMTMANYVYATDVEFINKSFFESMSPEDQQALVDICKEAQVAAFERQKELEEDYVQQCIDNGVTVTYLTEEELGEFKAAMEADVYPWIIEQIGQERWDTFQSYLNK